MGAKCPRMLLVQLVYDLTGPMPSMVKIRLLMNPPGRLNPPPPSQLFQKLFAPRMPDIGLLHDLLLDPEY